MIKTSKIPQRINYLPGLKLQILENVPGSSKALSPSSYQCRCSETTNDFCLEIALYIEQDGGTKRKGYYICRFRLSPAFERRIDNMPSVLNFAKLYKQTRAHLELDKSNELGLEKLLTTGIDKALLKSERGADLILKYDWNAIISCRDRPSLHFISTIAFHEQPGELSLEIASEKSISWRWEKRAWR